jgi:hypothetical protein
LYFFLVLSVFISSASPVAPHRPTAPHDPKKCSTRGSNPIPIGLKRGQLPPGYHLFCGNIFPHLLRCRRPAPSQGLAQAVVCRAGTGGGSAGRGGPEVVRCGGGAAAVARAGEGRQRCSAGRGGAAMVLSLLHRHIHRHIHQMIPLRW